MFGCFTAQTASRPAPALACPVWDGQKWPIMSLTNPVFNHKILSDPDCLRCSNKSHLVSFLPACFMTSDCSLTLFFPPSPQFYLAWLICDHHSFCSLLVSTKAIGLSSLPLSQSSVDHKEFKRCGPFDPYINAKVCTQRCWNNIPYWSAFFAFLLCWLAVLGFGLLLLLLLLVVLLCCRGSGRLLNSPTTISRSMSPALSSLRYLNTEGCLLQ